MGSKDGSRIEEFILMIIIHVTRMFYLKRRRIEYNMHYVRSGLFFALAYSRTRELLVHLLHPASSSKKIFSKDLFGSRPTITAHGAPTAHDRPRSIQRGREPAIE